MITQIQTVCYPVRPCTPRPEWGYRLYAALLAEAPERFGAQVHENAATPLSQHLTIREDAVIWTVNLLGEASEGSLLALLEGKSSFYLEKDRVRLTVTDRRTKTIQSVDELFAQAGRASGVHRLRFETPAAFKSQGRYINLPTSRLIVQSLIQKWNGCFPECPIEDADGRGMEAIADGLWCGGFRLFDRTYRLKGNAIPGFVGEMTMENRLSGFHRELADVLLLFSAYSGIGIKTALGMGGVAHGFI